MIEVGDKIKFEEEVQRYTVQACDNRYAICTKAFNPKKTVLYTVIDFKYGIRSTENLIFCLGFETRKECEECLERLNKKESALSHRRELGLNIEKINQLTPQNET